MPDAAPDDESLPDAEPAPPDPSPVEVLTERVGKLEEVLAAHLADARGLTRDALRQAHAEIDKYRDAAGLGALRPLLNELLAVYDDVAGLVAHYLQAAEPVSPRDVADNFDGVRAQLEEVFARRGVVRIGPPARTLDRDMQRAVRVSPTTDPADDLAVLEEVRAGFAGPAGVVRRTDVVVAKYTSTPEGTT